VTTADMIINIAGASCFHTATGTTALVTDADKSGHSQQGTLGLVRGHGFEGARGRRRCIHC